MNMNPQNMMQFVAAIGTFKNNHPKFAAFVEHFVKVGVTEGTVIEITVTKPGEEPMTTNMKVERSEIEMLSALK